MRKGIYDLRLYFNEDCEEYFNPSNGQVNQKDFFKTDANATEITANDVDLNIRDHHNKDLLINDKNILFNNKDIDADCDNNLSSIQKHRNLTKNFDYNTIQFNSVTQYLQNDLNSYPDGGFHSSQKIKQLTKVN